VERDTLRSQRFDDRREFGDGMDLLVRACLDSAAEAPYDEFRICIYIMRARWGNLMRSPQARSGASPILRKSSSQAYECR
jgi:hypothetical protein